MWRPVKPERPVMRARRRSPPSGCFMSFIALDICGGRFAKGCRIKGMILHALSGDASYLPISNIIAAERWGSSRNGVTHEYVQFRSAPVLRGFPAFCASLFRIDLFLD